MSSRTIRVDDEVYAALQRRAEPFVDTPNSTLRKLLGLTPGSGRPEASDEAPTDDLGTESAGGTSPREQRLAPFLNDGRLEAGQRLVWHRRNLKQTHHATVLANGNLRLDDGREFGSPSGAATEIAGNPQNGLKCWATEDGKRLSEL
ncbi:DUF4357 domain-containing protein [Streptomyces sp. SID3343]|uniref:DUF4357 domain-containing protein n=1 Tax=Streptomyces sp. SID3343 TaxID=2690260 RepID=UPI00136ECBE5|nr:DUF4357 domain-containing protein [Streptomyces sp. SID3343]MYW05313.1 DUF4357 domain-containing protein [Streptomyces sp. SID3343]